MKKLMIALALAALCLSARNAHAQGETDAQVIVSKANHAAYYQGKDARARVGMTITDAQGRTRNKLFIMLKRDDPPPEGKDELTYDADQRFYVYFMLPPDERKTVFMVWKHMDKDDDRWLYLPALDLVKQIASTEKRTSFVGSNFFYEDVSGRHLNADTHELTKTTDNYYVVRNTPKDASSVEFAHYDMWIIKENFIPRQVAYFDRKGEKYRLYTADKVETIQGYPTVTQATIKDLRTGGQTTITYSDVKYDVGIPESIFTERYLRIPPSEYLK